MSRNTDINVLKNRAEICKHGGNIYKFAINCVTQDIGLEQ